MFPKLNLPTYSFRIKQQLGKLRIYDEIRKKYLVLTPEEWVRQNFVRFLIEEKGFPAQLMALESGLTLNRNQFRADLLVYNRMAQPLLVVEFKAPSVKITQDAFDQVARYNMKFKVPYLIVSNGLDHYCCVVDFDAGTYSFLKEVPAFDELG